MATTAKKAILKAKLEGVITQLIVETNAENVLVDENTTLAEKLAEILTASEVETKISTAISELINGAPETYDTLKEIADYISEHQEVVATLNAAIGDKVSTATFEAFQATLGTLATKSTISESDLDEALAAKVNTTWDNKATIYYSATEPTDLKEGDLWVQLVDETAE